MFEASLPWNKRTTGRFPVSRQISDSDKADLAKNRNFDVFLTLLTMKGKAILLCLCVAVTLGFPEQGKWSLTFDEVRYMRK